MLSLKRILSKPVSRRTFWLFLPFKNWSTLKIRPSQITDIACHHRVWSIRARAFATAESHGADMMIGDALTQGGASIEKTQIPRASLFFFIFTCVTWWRRDNRGKKNDDSRTLTVVSSSRLCMHWIVAYRQKDINLPFPLLLADVRRGNRTASTGWHTRAPEGYFFVSWECNYSVCPTVQSAPVGYTS